MVIACFRLLDSGNRNYAMIPFSFSSLRVTSPEIGAVVTSEKMTLLLLSPPPELREPRYLIVTIKSTVG